MNIGKSTEKTVAPIKIRLSGRKGKRGGKDDSDDRKSFCHVVSELLRFMAPANYFVAKIIPFYTTLILLLFYAVKHFLNIDLYDHYFMFFTGFTLTMHIILTAQDLQDNEKSFIKPTYLFVMMCGFILMVFFVTLLFNLMMKEFAFLEFLESMWVDASEVYYVVLRKLLRLG